MKRFFTSFAAVALLLFIGASLNAQTQFYSEDFANGMPMGWTTEDPSPNWEGLWTWCNDPASGVGDCPLIWGDANNLQVPFAATTAANGFMTINSDAVAANVNDPHNSILTTAPIDCSAQAEVWTTFETHIGSFDLDPETNAFLEVSSDGGATWTQFTAFPGLTTGATEPGVTRWSFNPALVILDISSVAANQSEVWIRWNWTAGFEYHWSVDDVSLYDGDPTPLLLDANDLRINPFAAVAPNALTPASQVSPFGFIADIFNAGGSAQTNVNLNISIVDNTSGSVVHAEDFDYGTIDFDSLAENQVFPSQYTPALDVVTTYTGTYTLSADAEDSTPEDNTLSFNFETTDSTFSKENGITNGGLAPADVTSWAMGMYYHVPNGDGLNISSVSFNVTNPSELAGQDVSILVYRYTDDGLDSGTYTPEEMELIGFNTQTFEAEMEDNTTFTVPLLGFPSLEPVVPVQNDGEYVILIAYNQPDGQDTNLSLGFSQELNYDATFWLTTPADTTFFGGGQGPRRLGPLVCVGPHSLEDNEIFGSSFSAGFGGDLIPAIRMNLNPPMPVGVEELDPANVINVYPVPTKDNLTVDFDLVETATDLELRIVDAKGKLMLNRSYSNVDQQKFNFDVSDFAAGNYFIHIITEKGARSKYFVVFK